MGTVGPIVRNLGKRKCARVLLKEIATKSSVVMHILKMNWDQDPICKKLKCVHYSKWENGN